MPANTEVGNDYLWSFVGAGIWRYAGSKTSAKVWQNIAVMIVAIIGL
jgi:hypothetical protein